MRDIFLAAAIPGLLEAAPDLAKAFGTPDPEEAVNQTAVAEIAEAIALQVTGAPNIQAAVETLQTDSDKRQSFQTAVRVAWYNLDKAYVEPPDSGIQAARDFALSYGGRPRNWPLELVTYLFTLIFGGASVVVVWRAEFSAEQVTMVLQAVIGLSIMVGGFWLGSSYTTSRSRGMGEDLRGK